MTTPCESDYPVWLPIEMRHTATPSERLRSLLPRLLERRDPLLLKLRARKAQLLCLQIDPAACAGAGENRVPPDQADLAIQMAVDLFEHPEMLLLTNEALISVVHQSAGAICALAEAAIMQSRH